MKRWIWIALAGAVFVIGCAVWLSPRFVAVQPGQQGVLERRDGVEVLEPGPHLVGPFAGEFVLYDALFEREHVIAEPVMVEDCPVVLRMIYNISDVVAFHAAGGDIAAVAEMDPDIRALAQAQDLTLETLGGPAMTALRAAVQDIAPPGIGVFRLSADVQACGAGDATADAGVRIERLAMEIILADGPLGAERADLGALPLVTADDARLDLSGAVATYDVLDADQASRCFGTVWEGLASDVMANAASMDLRRGVGGLQRQDVPDALATLGSGEAARFEADCGLRIGPVDFSAARLEWVRAAQ